MRGILLAVSLLAFAVSASAKGAHGGHGGGRSYGHSVSNSGHTRSASGTGAKSAHEHVSGYTTKKGTRVAGYNRSTRDGTKANNWSTKGNVNPETGKRGTK